MGKWVRSLLYEGSMTTRVEVINIALQFLNKRNTSFLDSDDPFVVAAEAQYDFMKDACLGAFPWRFATREVELAKLVQKPLTTFYENYFQIPSDCIAIERVEPNQYQYDIENKGLLLANADSLLLVYRYRVEEEFWPLYFADYMAATLAQRLALTTAQNITLAQTLKLLRDDNFAKAMFIDNQNKPNYLISDQKLINVRYAGSRYRGA